MDGCAHIVRSSVGCHALPGSESVGVPMFDLVNASQFGQSRPHLLRMLRNCPHRGAPLEDE